MTGSHEVDGSIPFSSTNENKEALERNRVSFFIDSVQFGWLELLIEFQVDGELVLIVEK